MTVFSADFASVAAERAKRIDLIRLVGEIAEDLPGRILTVDTYPEGPRVLIDDVDPSEVTERFGPPQTVRSTATADHWCWLHPAGFEVRLVEAKSAA